MISRSTKTWIYIVETMSNSDLTNNSIVLKEPQQLNQKRIWQHLNYGTQILIQYSFTLKHAWKKNYGSKFDDNDQQNWFNQNCIIWHYDLEHHY